MKITLFTLPAILLLARAAVAAEENQDSPPQPAQAAPAEEQAQGKSEKQETVFEDPPLTGGAPGRIEVSGRVFARAELQRIERNLVDGTGIVRPTDVESLDLTVPNARVRLRYRALDWLTAEIEMDVADKPLLRDAYVQVRGKPFSGVAGQFKMPVSYFEMDSPWNLPIARRGFLHDLWVDRLDIAGRRPGAMAVFRGKGKHDLKLMLGAFQGSVVVAESVGGARETDLLLESKLFSQHLVGRADGKLRDVNLGVWYQHRLGTPAILVTEHYWTAGVDAYLDHVLANGGLRIWFDTMAGASWFEHAQKVRDDEDATFVGGRVLGAYRFGGVDMGTFYVEVFGLAGVLDPDVDVTSDLAWEAVAGVNVGLWRWCRVTLQGEVNRVQRNFPAGYFLGRNPDREALLLQVGAVF